jgi:putative transposase
MAFFVQDSSESTSAQWLLVSDQLREKFPKLAAMMDSAEQGVLEFMSFPHAHRAQIHSTNPLERLNAEAKRPTNVRTYFPNRGRVSIKASHQLGQISFYQMHQPRRQLPAYLDHAA